MEVQCKPQYRPRERAGFQIVLHEPEPDGSVKYLVYRLPKPGLRLGELAGCGTGANIDNAQIAADDMVTRLAVSQWRQLIR